MKEVLKRYKSISVIKWNSVFFSKLATDSDKFLTELTTRHPEIKFMLRLTSLEIFIPSKFNKFIYSLECEEYSIKDIKISSETKFYLNLGSFIDIIISSLIKFSSLKTNWPIFEHLIRDLQGVKELWVNLNSDFWRKFIFEIRWCKKPIEENLHFWMNLK